MPYKNICVTIKPEQLKYLKENGLSPSKIIQESINKHREDQRIKENNKIFKIVWLNTKKTLNEFIETQTDENRFTFAINSYYITKIDFINAPVNESKFFELFKKNYYNIMETSKNFGLMSYSLDDKKTWLDLTGDE